MMKGTDLRRLVKVILEEKSIFMVFHYAEHDFLVRLSPSPAYIIHR